MKLYTRTWGDKASQKSAVLVHGVTSSSAGWVRVGPCFAEWGYFVVAPDLRGHGASPKPDSEYALDIMVNDLADSIPFNPNVLVGHSYGGVMALLAIKNGVFSPSYLILEDPVLHLSSREFPENHLKNEEKNLPRDVEGILKANPKWHREDAESKMASLQVLNWNHMQQVFAWNAPWDFRGLLCELGKKIKVLLILPEKSIYVPEEDAKMIENALGSNTVIHFPGTGHNIHRDDLDGYMNAIRLRMEMS